MNIIQFCKALFVAILWAVALAVPLSATAQAQDDSMKDCPLMGQGHDMENCPMKTTTASSHAGNDQKYAGMETRKIKALSEDQIKQYYAGEGMGLAMPAELNHYPGPKHLLDFSETLHLTPAQEASLRSTFDAMHAQAVKLGEQIVARERMLDSLFAAGTITQEQLSSTVNEIAALQGTLRITHLQAHLGTRTLLTAEQIKAYDGLRGYGKTKPSKQPAKHKS